MRERRICPACAEWFTRDEDRPREDGTHNTRWWLFVCSRECWADHESMPLQVLALTGHIVSVAQLADDPWVQESLRYALRRRRELLDNDALASAAAALVKQSDQHRQQVEQACAGLTREMKERTESIDRQLQERIDAFDRRVQEQRDAAPKAELHCPDRLRRYRDLVGDPLCLPNTPLPCGDSHHTPGRCVHCAGLLERVQELSQL